MKLIITLLFFVFVTRAPAQSVGINTSTPHPSAMLDIKSNPTIGPQGVTLPHVALPSITDQTIINGGSPADGLMVYNLNDSLTGGKGIYFWSGAKQEWRFLVNQENARNFNDLVRYYTSRTQAQINIPTVPLGAQRYIVGESINNGWTSIPSLTMNIRVDRPENFANIKFSGTVIGSHSSQIPNTSVEMGYGIFIDDKLVFGIADTSSYQRRCNYNNFYTSSIVKDITVGPHIVKFAVKLRRVAQNNNPTANFPSGTTLTVGGGNGNCDNLNDLEAQSLATFYLNQKY